jgi:hypothetical protein
VTGDLNFGRTGHEPVPLPNGEALVVGDDNRRMEKYDPGAGTWREAGMMTLLGQQAHTTTLLEDGTVLIAGGRLFDMTHAEIYDPLTETS